MSSFLEHDSQSAYPRPWALAGTPPAVDYDVSARTDVIRGSRTHAAGLRLTAARQNFQGLQLDREGRHRCAASTAVGDGPSPRRRRPRTPIRVKPSFHDDV